MGLKLDLERFEALREARPERTSMALPFPDGEVDLRLQRFDVRSDAFEVAVTGPDGFRSVEPRTRIVTYEVEGEVTGTLILFHDHVVASLQRDGRRWELNRRSGDVHALFPVDASTDDRTFTCSKGQRKLFKMHVTFGGSEDPYKNAQLYYDVLPNGQIEVAHVGRHLRTVSHNT